VIRFGAVLTVVVVAMGLLAGGVLTNSLLLVYLAIGVAALSAVMLAVGLVIWRGDIFGEASAEQAAAPVGVSAGTAPAPVGRVPVGQTAASVGLGPSTLLVAGGNSTLGRDDPAAPPAPALPWRLEDLPEPERLPEPADLRKPEDLPEPEDLPGPEDLREPPDPWGPADRWEPERLPEPEDLREPVRLPEPEDLREPERRAEPVRLPEPAKLRESERLQEPKPEPEDLREPVRLPEPEDLREPEHLPEPEPEPEDLHQERQQGLEQPAEQTAPKSPEAEAAPHAEAAAEAEAAPDADAEPAGDTELGLGGGKDAPSPVTQVTIVPGIARYHRSDCILIRFLGPEDLETMTRQAAEDAGCVPCKACRPEQQLADA
jgi:hypothetical protein